MFGEFKELLVHVVKLVKITLRENRVDFLLLIFFSKFGHQSRINRVVKMKNYLFVLLCIASLTACKSKKPFVDVETLPKDVALKPDRVNGASEQEVLAKEAEDLRIMMASIDSLGSSRVCSNAEDWRITALGSKPCGGPASYMAYHKEVEVHIIPVIQEYTRRQALFNQKRNMFSDCAIEPQPSGLRCDGGKAVLLHSSQPSSD
jgi:hypothetical protein